MTTALTDSPAYRRVYDRIAAARPEADEAGLHAATREFLVSLADRGAPAAAPTRSPVNLYVDEAGVVVTAQSAERPHTARVRLGGGRWRRVSPRGALRPATRDEIAEAGQESGLCQVCGRALTGQSRREGIGPKCRENLT